MTIKQVIMKLKLFPLYYTVRAYEGEKQGIVIENEDGEEVSFIEND